MLNYFEVSWPDDTFKLWINFEIIKKEKKFNWNYFQSRSESVNDLAKLLTKRSANSLNAAE